ncbi:MAG: hypothetical protein ACRDY7_10965 [Acidimicrobiia bacterium]
MWGRVWRTPAAVAWERLGWVDQVARYVRVLTRAEQRDASLPALVEARHFEDRLGLNPMGMLRLRWEVAADEVAAARQERPVPSRPEVVDRSATGG